jgi:hypothetical protein
MEPALDQASAQNEALLFTIQQEFESLKGLIKLRDEVLLVFHSKKIFGSPSFTHSNVPIVSKERIQNISFIPEVPQAMLIPQFAQSKKHYSDEKQESVDPFPKTKEITSQTSEPISRCL